MLLDINVLIYGTFHLGLRTPSSIGNLKKKPTLQTQSARLSAPCSHNFLCFHRFTAA